MIQTPKYPCPAFSAWIRTRAEIAARRMGLIADGAPRPFVYIGHPRTAKVLAEMGLSYPPGTRLLSKIPKESP